MRSLKLSEKKTPFGKSAFFSLIQAFIPGIVIWIVLGNDMHVLANFSLNLIWQLITCLIFLSWCLASTFIAYKLGYTNFDQFGFSVPICLVLITIFISSFYVQNIWARIAICVIAVLVTSTLVNLIIFWPKKRK